MIKDVTVDFILQLSLSGLSQRKIARKVGVARETVRRVLSGKRQKRNRISCGDLPSRFGKPSRCDECGGFVYKPCLACTVRSRERSA